MPKPLNKLIGICGKAGSGKDTLAEGLAKIDVYFIYHFADPIKNALNAMFGWGPVHWTDREWKEKPIDWLGVSPRVLAQTLGTEWGRDKIDRDLWLKIAQEKWRKASGTAVVNTKSNGQIAAMGMIIPDVRFENEAQWIRDAGGIVIEVVRPDLNEEVAAHSSEAGIPDTLIDLRIINNSTISQMISATREEIWQASLRS